MRPTVVSPAAAIDLDEQAEYLAARASLATALRFHEAAAETFAALARHPDIGEPWLTPNPRLVGLRVRRIDGFPSHLIFYQPAGEAIAIVRVLHASRDIDTLLSR